MDPDLLKALVIVGAWLVRLEAVYVHSDQVTEDEEEDLRLPDSLIMDLQACDGAFEQFFARAGDVGKFLVGHAADLRPPQHKRPELRIIEGDKHTEVRTCADPSHD